MLPLFRLHLCFDQTARSRVPFKRFAVAFYTFDTFLEGNNTKTHNNTQLNITFLTFYFHGPASTPLRPRIERLKKYCSHFGARIFGLWRGFGEGACPQWHCEADVRLTEPKRSQNPKGPLPYSFPPNGYSIYDNAQVQSSLATIRTGVKQRGGGNGKSQSMEINQTIIYLCYR